MITKETRLDEIIDIKTIQLINDLTDINDKGQRYHKYDFDLQNKLIKIHMENLIKTIKILNL